jgi:hypothetical protein
MVQSLFVGADKYSAMAQRVVKCYTARAADRKSKSQSKSLVGGARFGVARLEVAIAAIITYADIHLIACYLRVF